MSSALEKRYKELLAEAKVLEREYPASATDIYLDCATIVDALADATSDAFLQSERRKLAEELRRHAGRLKRGEIIEEEGYKYPKNDEKAKSFILADKPKIRFKDIAGLEGVKEQIKEAIVYPFKYPDEYKYFGVKGGGGILLYGPPRCGKTMLATAAAGECEAVFINLKTSDIKDKYVGESEKRIKEVFELARKLRESDNLFR